MLTPNFISSANTSILHSRLLKPIAYVIFPHVNLMVSQIYVQNQASDLTCQTCSSPRLYHLRKWQLHLSICLGQKQCSHRASQQTNLTLLSIHHSYRLHMTLEFMFKESKRNNVYLEKWLISSWGKERQSKFGISHCIRK